MIQLMKWPQLNRHKRSDTSPTREVSYDVLDKLRDLENFFILRSPLGRVGWRRIEPPPPFVNLQDFFGYVLNKESHHSEV